MWNQLVRIDLDGFDPAQIEDVNYAMIDATMEDDIAHHSLEDIHESKQVAGEEIREIRQRMGMTQDGFSDALHISVRILRNWAQGVRLPTGPARTLLKIVGAKPEMALDVLSKSDPRWVGVAPSAPVVPRIGPMPARTSAHLWHERVRDRRGSHRCLASPLERFASSGVREHFLGYTECRVDLRQFL
jgi:putative transcriptional regulator